LHIRHECRTPNDEHDGLLVQHVMSAP
jgi:hypothetical protein